MAPNPKKGGKTKSSRAKKKAWYTILAPKGFNSMNLGETAAFEPDNLKGRAVKVNLMNLTNDPRSQHINMTFKINKVVGVNAETEVFKYEIIGSHLKRLVRRNRDRVDHSFMCKTKDGLTARIKFMIVTRNRVNHAVQTVLRSEATNDIAAFFTKLTLEDGFKDIIFNKIQRSLRSKLSKVTPLRNFEIKVIKLDLNKKNQPLVQPTKESLAALEARTNPEKTHPAKEAAPTTQPEKPAAPKKE